jgi:hypothetical protein
VDYLDSLPETAWTIPLLSSLQDEFGIKVVGGMDNNDGVTNRLIENYGMTNFGQLGKFDFFEHLSRSFVLVGVGRPKISPSPWDALCMGVPVSVVSSP